MRVHCVKCVCIALNACALHINCVLYICIALYACALHCMQTNQLPPPLHWTVCVCVHCVCIACALRAMPICIGPRQGLVTAHDRYARQTGAGVHCAGRANLYRAEARTLQQNLLKRVYKNDYDLVFD